MNKISTDIMMGVLLDAGMEMDKVIRIVNECSSQENIRQKQDKQSKPAKLQDDGYIVLVKDADGILSPTASALIIKKTQCSKDAEGSDVAPCLWPIAELTARVDSWMHDCVIERQKLDLASPFDTVLHKFPKKYAKPYGFSFLTKETVPIYAVDDNSAMQSMFNFNDLKSHKDS